MMEKVKRLFSISKFLDQEHERTEKIMRDVEEIKTLDGEGEWFLKKVKNKDDCHSTCDDLFEGD